MTDEKKEIGNCGHKVAYDLWAFLRTLTEEEQKKEIELFLKCRSVVLKGSKM